MAAGGCANVRNLAAHQSEDELLRGHHRRVAGLRGGYGEILDEPWAYARGHAAPLTVTAGAGGGAAPPGPRGPSSPRAAGPWGLPRGPKTRTPRPPNRPAPGW